MVASGTWTDPLAGATYLFGQRLTSSDMNSWIAGIRAIDLNVVTSAIRTWPNIIPMNGTDLYLDGVVDETTGTAIFVGSDAGGANVVVDYTTDWSTITGGTIATTDSAQAVETDGAGVVVMGIGKAAGSTDLVYSSASAGDTWTARTLPQSSKYAQSVVHNGSVFVVAYSDAATAAYIASSPDGATWTDRANPLSNTFWRPSRLSGAAVDENGAIVLLPDGSSSQVAYSADGITWSAATLTSTDYWAAVAYTPTYKWIAYDDSGSLIYTSSTGASWSVAASATTPAAATGVSGLTSIGDVLIMRYIDGTDNFLVYSTDGGATWSGPALRILGTTAVSMHSSGGRLLVMDYTSNETVYISSRTPVGD